MVATADKIPHRRRVEINPTSLLPQLEHATLLGQPHTAMTLMKLSGLAKYRIGAMSWVASGHIATMHIVRKSSGMCS
jgi:hypothetical protein